MVCSIIASCYPYQNRLGIALIIGQIDELSLFVVVVISHQERPPLLYIQEANIFACI
jgi:hypothetical protein